MHIQSIESLLSRKDEEIEKLNSTQRLFMNSYSHDLNQKNIYNNNNSDNNTIQNEEITNYKTLYYSNENLYENNSKSYFANTDFKKNEENERELKKLINSNQIKKTGNPFVEMNDSMNYNFNSSDFKSTNNSIKVPGRIFSSKKKF